MGRAMVVRLGLGLLLLALLLPAQIYANQTTLATESSSLSQNVTTTTTTTSPINATTRGDASALQSTAASLLVVSLSLLHLYC